MNKKILIVEDDADINNMLSILLIQNGYDTVSAFSGTEGLLVHDDSIDIVLLDLMLPGKSGEEIITDLKRRHNVPVIVISAIHNVEKKVGLFELGADDYVTKPFNNDELLARIAARLRSGSETGSSETLSYKNIVANKAEYSVICCGKECELSRLEFDLLYMLMQKPGWTCTKTAIFDNVWNYEDSADDNTLKVHISKIRKKLKECDPDTEYIETVWGIGYRLKKD